MTDKIVFDKEKLRKLKKLYKSALERGADSFLFEGKEVLTAYAKYMIQFVETQLK